MKSGQLLRTDEKSSGEVYDLMLTQSKKGLTMSAIFLVLSSGRKTNMTIYVLIWQRKIAKMSRSANGRSSRCLETGFKLRKEEEADRRYLREERGRGDGGMSLSFLRARL